MDNIEIKLEQIKVLIETLINKTQETNRLLKDGISTKWGHQMGLLDMDPTRFDKNDGKHHF